ncbi:hypothetical protein [uncultured Thiohalocapsa sp.]|uniref:hypothetical protein n=1 Tax=uncultured Thiohalocapsa sp. TaxID=768990 RepID=UPI0025D86FC4|nr:hypothetical protein [uncultured Thiohalocapsa sp.]
MTASTIDATGNAATWLWPRLIDAGAQPTARAALRAASVIEWRYYAVLSPAFHGIVGLALVNPQRRFGLIAESGLLVIVAGVLDRPTPPASAATAPDTPQLTPPPAFCWMHLFPTETCSFDAGAPGSVTAGDADCCIAVAHDGPAVADIELEAGAGLLLRLSHVGLAGSALAPAHGQDFPGALGSGWLGAHWSVDCPSPVAASDGSLTLGEQLLWTLAEGPGSTPGYATAALRRRVAAGHNHWSWRSATGYYEHSYGIRPLPLHGWDFLFVPDADAGQAVVLQTYRGSRALRYLDVCWRQAGEHCHQRFGAAGLDLTWAERVRDPVLGVRRPRLRRIEAAANGLRLSLTNRVLYHLPLLRRERAAVRHFFISEEIGVADWRLTDSRGTVLASAQGQPCGGELAHRRWRAPRAR